MLDVSRLELKPTQPTTEWVLGVLPGGKRLGLIFIIEFYVGPMIRIHGVVPPSPHMNSECGAELSFKVYSTLLRTFFMICS
jgi:hypothetical protein